jgi:6-phosphogluconolactonase (cycloisomerase 2 family)
MGSNGNLTQIAGSPFLTAPAPKSISIDPSGRYLYVVSATANNTTVFHIDRNTGQLTQVAGSPFPAGDSPSSVATSGIIY